jgi:hypothetical protein
MQTIGQYQIDIFRDDTYKSGSFDNVNKYEFEYFNESEYVFPSTFGIKLFDKGNLFKSAIIGSNGGGTGIHSNSVIYEENRFVICCSDTIFCLSIPDLKLFWKIKADQFSCFGIFKYQDNYIVHGELEISRLDHSGNILWQHSGADIFTTISGQNGFNLSENFIEVADFENRIYRFDYEGKDYTDKTQFPWLKK